ncbi:MAG TPA: DUF3592 domain-containing protein [Xanthobacteraceae bacterium]|nr:DUF3592 domain-containing protein [Xanthobacteraceae bacterium]
MTGQATTHKIIPFLVFFLFLAILFFREYRRSKKRIAFARGRVLRVRIGNRGVREPEVEFWDLRGQRVEFIGGGASWNTWPEGSTVQVFYDPENPTNASIEPTAGMSFFWVILGLAGVLFFGLIAYSTIFGN